MNIKKIAELLALFLKGKAVYFTQWEEAKVYGCDFEITIIDLNRFLHFKIKKVLVITKGMMLPFRISIQRLYLRRIESYGMFDLVKWAKYYKKPETIDVFVEVRDLIIPKREFDLQKFLKYFFNL